MDKILPFYEFTDLSGNKDLFTGISEFHFTALSDDITGKRCWRYNLYI